MMTAMRPLVLTSRSAAILAAPLAKTSMPKPYPFKAGDRVCVIGNTDHPTMIVVGSQPDLFRRDEPAAILCTWMARDKDGRPVRRHRHFEPAALARCLGLVEGD